MSSRMSDRFTVASVAVGGLHADAPLTSPASLEPERCASCAQSSWRADQKIKSARCLAPPARRPASREHAKLASAHAPATWCVAPFERREHAVQRTWICWLIAEPQSQNVHAYGQPRLVSMMVRALIDVEDPGLAGDGITSRSTRRGRSVVNDRVALSERDACHVAQDRRAAPAGDADQRAQQPAVVISAPALDRDVDVRIRARKWLQSASFLACSVHHGS